MRTGGLSSDVWLGSYPSRGSLITTTRSAA